MARGLRDADRSPLLDSRPPAAPAASCPFMAASFSSRASSVSTACPFSSAVAAFKKVSARRRIALDDPQGCHLLLKGILGQHRLPHLQRCDNIQKGVGKKRGCARHSPGLPLSPPGHHPCALPVPSPALHCFHKTNQNDFENKNSASLQRLVPPSWPPPSPPGQSSVNAARPLSSASLSSQSFSKRRYI